MGSLNKLVKKAIKDSEVKEDNLAADVATTAKFGPNAVDSAKIGNGTVTTDDLASTLDLSPKTVTLPDGTINFDREHFNIALLGFKMAVNENLTVFNLVDGVVDEFHDESGTDEAEGSNDTYCASSDLYTNQVSGSLSAGFSMTAVTEADTSTAGTNPKFGTGSPGTFAKSAGTFNLTIYTWGAGGAGGHSGPSDGGGGGFSTGVYNNYEGETLHVMAGEGGGSYGCTPVCGVNRKNISAIGGDHPLAPGPGPGSPGPSGPITSGNRGGGGKGEHAGGGGLAYVGTAVVDQENAPNIIMIGGAGGGGGGGGGSAGAGGGTSGQDGSGPGKGEGGSQTAGGEGYAPKGYDGGFLYGGNGDGPQGGGGGGAGYYGGGGGGFDPSPHGSAGGGSSYIGHPQITSGSTEGGNNVEGGGTADPNYQSSTNEGGGTQTAGEDGYVLITGTFNVAQNTTIISNAFASGSVPTSSRIVVFEENVDTPTLNTDIIASISRDGGSNFTTATLSDSGYVTGASGQRILTGQATISGQPSGQSMRWKLALANNKVKIHGVSLSWA